jgi:hypothetical protein
MRTLGLARLVLLPPVALLAPMLAAQTASAPPPLVRGVLLERDTQTASGEFSLRAADNQVFRYQFDRKTYVERENQSIDVARLDPGERVEVLSDTVPGLALRYARTVHVMEDPPPVRPLSEGRLRAYRDAAERAVPTGNLTFSGVVFRLSGERLVLHTRAGDQAILLRQDTRFVENGAVVEAGSLKINTRVFVRGAKDLYDQVVGYQVIWGQILDPGGRGGR